MEQSVSHVPDGSNFPAARSLLFISFCPSTPLLSADARSEWAHGVHFRQGIQNNARAQFSFVKFATVETKFDFY
jgi:hypothetical protein